MWEGKEIINTEWRPLDQTRVYFRHGDGIAWVDIESRSAEDMGLIKSTPRMRKKPQEQIDRENRNIKLFQIGKALLAFIFLVYSINTENVIGTGIFMGLFICAAALPFLDLKYTDEYEKRK